MFAVEIYAAVRRFVFIEGKSRREAARVFGLSRDTKGLVKYSRANFLTPVPHAASFEALNAMLEERCRARQNERASRHEQTIGERLAADNAALRDLPATPFEPCLATNARRRSPP
jgi:hypothetical protein